MLIDCVKKRDWRGVRRALLEAAADCGRELARTARSLLRTWCAAVVIGWGLYQGVSLAAQLDGLIDSRPLLYVLDLSGEGVG